ncbi:MAG: RHS repeat protein, partial [Rhodocyclaceae bacterium]|nr:RHS repeat protein [Rhodocyclaceae bacterium]
PAHPLYPIWPAQVALTAGKMLPLADWTITAPPPEERFTAIANTTADQQVTDTRFPGLAVTLPAGVTITGWDGVRKTRIAVERVDPLDAGLPNPPVPMKELYQFFFGTPMGGIPSAPIPVTLPNVAQLDPGDKSEIWYFDGSPMGGSGEWKLAGLGTVSADGKTVASDPGAGIPRFCGKCGFVGLGCPPAPNPPQPADPPCQTGNPIDLYSGQETPSAGAARCDGRVPLEPGWRYNPVDAFNNRAGTLTSFGYGWTFSYDIALLPFSGVQKRLILPGGILVNFVDDGSGTYRPENGRRLSGATLRASNAAANEWQLTQPDGTRWQFAPFPGISGVIRGGPPTFLTRIDYPDGGALGITRAGNGRIQSFGSGERVISFSYGANGFVNALIDPAGRNMSFTYSAAGHVETMTDAEGGVTRYTYQADAELGADPACAAAMPPIPGARMASILRPGHSQATQNFHGPGTRVLRQIADNGQENRFDYELTGACVTHVSQPGVRCTGASCPTVDSWDNYQAGWRIHGGQVVATTLTEADGSRRRIVFDARGAATKQSDAIGQPTRTELDANGRPARRTDALGRSTRYSYDERGNVIRTVDSLNRITDTAYDPIWNKPASVTRYLENGAAVTQQFQYDRTTGNLTRSVDPSGQASTYAYTASGQLASIIDPLGHSRRFDYNAAGDLIQITDPLGNETRIGTDNAGRATSHTNPLGHTGTQTWTGLDQPKTSV